MVRGLDYYTRTAFEVVSYQLGSQNAVAGGGRYDNLFQEIGGKETPGIGFAIGMERLISLLPEGKQFVNIRISHRSPGEAPLKRPTELSINCVSKGFGQNWTMKGESEKSDAKSG